MLVFDVQEVMANELGTQDTPRLAWTNGSGTILALIQQFTYVCTPHDLLPG